MCIQTVYYETESFSSHARMEIYLVVQKLLGAAGNFMKDTAVFDMPGTLLTALMRCVSMWTIQFMKLMQQVYNDGGYELGYADQYFVS